MLRRLPPARSSLGRQEPLGSVFPGGSLGTSFLHTNHPMKHYPATIFVAALTILAAIFPALTNAWQLNFDVVQDGQWWRLWTGHVTHYDGSHLFWDLLMFVALSISLERKHARGFAVAMVTMMPIVGMAVWWTCPDIAAYRGLSGLDTGLFVWFVTEQICDAFRLAKRVPAMLWSATLLGLVGKLIYEASTGDTLFVDSSSFRPLVQSHLAGAVLGGIYAACGICLPCSWYTYLKTSATA